MKSRIAHRNQDKVCQCRTDVSHNHSVLEKWLMDDGNHTGKYFLSCSYLYMFNSHCRAVHSCALNICSLQYIIRMWLRPEPAVFDGFGLAWRFQQPKPLNARPKPWFQVKPSQNITNHKDSTYTWWQPNGRLYHNIYKHCDNYELAFPSCIISYFLIYNVLNINVNNTL